MNGLYHPAELAIIADYLQIERAPEAAAIDLGNLPADAPEWLGNYSRLGDPARIDRAAAVAHLVLERIQQRLPTFVIGNESGWVSTREIASVPTRDVAGLPLHLFTINWADSGPGFSWPEVYHVGWLPGFEVHVVTASVDDVDPYGFCDIALGHFPGGRSLLDGAREAILAHRHQRDGCPEYCFEELWDTGLVDGGTVFEWSDSVWGEEATPRDVGMWA